MNHSTIGDLAMSLLDRFKSLEIAAIPEAELCELYRERELMVLLNEYSDQVFAASGKRDLQNNVGDILDMKTERLRALSHSSEFEQRYGPVFVRRRTSDGEVVGVQLTAEEWATEFVVLLRLCRNRLAEATAADDPGKLLCSMPSTFLMRLFACAAHAGGWLIPPEVQRDWEIVRQRLDELHEADKDRYQGKPKMD